MLSNNTNLIYAYRKKSIDKIVYVGQTKNLKERHYRHVKTDPFNESTKEFNYPLSKGIRLYGEQEYDLIILEDNLPADKLNEREIYWIAFYDTYYQGYNQSTGGSNPVMPIFTEEKIDVVIEMLQDESYSFEDIKTKTGISMAHISNINTGKRRKRDGLNYPIRKANTQGSKGLLFSPDECIQIHELLKTTEMAYEEIAEQFNCTKTTISDINRGVTKNYRLSNYNYPIRDSSLVRRIGCRYAWATKRKTK